MENKKEISNYEKQVDIGKKIFMEYDQNMLIRKFNLEHDEQWIDLRYMNQLYRISREDGTVEEQTQDYWCECRSYNTVMTIYDLLCHSKGEFPPVLSGEWCTANQFSMVGSPESGYFTKKYAQLFQDHVDELKSACACVGGILQKRMAGADVTCLIQITSFFPVLLQFWEGDDEFAPKLTLFWDKNALQFLHFETSFFLQGDLLERIKKHMKIGS